MLGIGWRPSFLSNAQGLCKKQMAGERGKSSGFAQCKSQKFKQFEGSGGLCENNMWLNRALIRIFF
jgi:hypothetical protein